MNFQISFYWRNSIIENSSTKNLLTFRISLFNNICCSLLEGSWVYIFFSI